MAFGKDSLRWDPATQHLSMTKSWPGGQNRLTDGEMTFYSQGLERAQNIDWLNAPVAHSSNCMYIPIDARKNKRGIT